MIEDEKPIRCHHPAWKKVHFAKDVYTLECLSCTATVYVRQIDQRAEERTAAFELAQEIRNGKPHAVLMVMAEALCERLSGNRLSSAAEQTPTFKVQAYQHKRFMVEGEDGVVYSVLVGCHNCIHAGRDPQISPCSSCILQPEATSNEGRTNYWRHRNEVSP